MSLLFLAIAPVCVIIFYIYIKDKYDKEPFGVLAKTFLMGATISVAATFLIGFLLESILPVVVYPTVLNQFFKAFVVVGLVEEFSKYIIVRYYVQPKAVFNEPFDGIVYCVMVSMGFAALENVLYTVQYGVPTGIMRAFTAVPAHATFGVIMGYFMGKAKFMANKRRYNLLGLLCATIFHGSYDFFLFIDFIPGIYSGAFISLIVALYLSKKAIQKHQDNSFFKN